MKKYCVVTGSRAEYGLLKNLLLKIKKDKSIDLKLVVTGTHLSKFYGNTYKEILKDGFKIDKKIYLPIKSDNKRYEIPKITGKAMEGFANTYRQLNPNIIILLGDRYEIFAAAFSALSMNIPIAHIHGGEKTLGSIDEHMRHSITKMSTLHFVSSNSHRKRVIQLGEMPKNIYHVGALAYESILAKKNINKKKFEEQLGFRLNKNNFLVTYHPETTKKSYNIKAFKNILNALDDVKDSNIIFTLSNADADGGSINKVIKSFVKKNKKKSIYFSSMGQDLYYCAIKYCDIVIGNTSSGIIEAPYFNTISINVGDRQKGRISANSVIQSMSDKLSIEKSIKKAFRLNKSKQKTIFKNPYGKLRSSKKILSILKKIKFKSLSTQKQFYDINQ